MNFSAKDITQKAREEAKTKYNEEKQKLALQMMIMSYYKIKSMLTESGLRKVQNIDQKRNNDDNYNKKFSEIILTTMDEDWSTSLAKLVTNISKQYGLVPGKDFNIEVENDHFSEEKNLDFYV
tara:strand:- start:3442 stop:3810 length:369 start_codon:yes stop_codon:yes gene_type:complete